MFLFTSIAPLTVKEFRDIRLETVKGDTVRKEVSMLSRILKPTQQEWDIYLPRGNPVDSVGMPPRLSPVSVKTPRSKVCAFMICGMKPLAVFLKWD